MFSLDIFESWLGKEKAGRRRVMFQSTYEVCMMNFRNVVAFRSVESLGISEEISSDLLF
jgi:hypothetical protein